MMTVLFVWSVMFCGVMAFLNKEANNDTERQLSKRRHPTAGH